MHGIHSILMDTGSRGQATGRRNNTKIGRVNVLLMNFNTHVRLPWQNDVSTARSIDLYVGSAGAGTPLGNHSA